MLLYVSAMNSFDLYARYSAFLKNSWQASWLSQHEHLSTLLQENHRYQIARLTHLMSTLQKLVALLSENISRQRQRVFELIQTLEVLSLRNHHSTPFCSSPDSWKMVSMFFLTFPKYSVFAITIDS